jgi:uncharacterized membrane protein YbhN (UPF0104 family)
MHKKFKFILKLIVTIVLFIFLFNKVDLNKTLFFLKDINFLIIIPVLLYPVGIFISTLKWKKILNSNLDVSFWNLYKIYWISNFFSNFLPSTIGGDSYKLVRLKQVGTKNIFISILLDRGSGVFSTLLLIFIGSFFFDILPFSKSFLLLVLLFLLLFLLSLKFLNKIPLVLKYYEIIIKNKKIIFQLVLLSILFLFLGGFSFWIFFYMFDFNLNFFHLFLIYLLIQIISMVPVSLNGWGLREVSFVSLVSFLGVAPEIALAIALVSRFASLIASGFGGLLFLFEKK